jgi:tripartite-type tricarboxylate transporter receptor subunit TctC
MMQLQRRSFLHVAAGVVALPALPRVASALDYPTRPVRIIVGFPAGGTPDLFARLIAEWLSQRLGQSFVVENRPGAATNIGTELVVRSPPDGYTLLYVTTPNLTNGTIYKNLTFNFLRDIAPVANVGGAPFVVVVNPAFPARTIPDFVAYAKANPGKINVTSTGTGNLTYMAAEYFKMLSGIDMVQVPARGEAAAQADLLADRVQVMFDPIPSSIGYIRAGKLRGLAVTAAQPVAILPDLPTVGQTVPGYEVVGTTGVGAPNGTPGEVIAKLNREINAGLDDPKLKARFNDLGTVTITGSPADFGKLLATETERWAKVIKFAGIKAE